MPSAQEDRVLAFCEAELERATPQLIRPTEKASSPGWCGAVDDEEVKNVDGDEAHVEESHDEAEAHAGERHGDEDHHSGDEVNEAERPK